MSTLLKEGQRLAGYEIRGLLGKGGMGEVYEARQISMDRVVALKVLSPKLVKRDPAFTEQFIAEARAAGRLNHSNIVGVHDVGNTTLEVEGQEIQVHYFSMELVVGETVKDMIEREGSLPLPAVGRILAAMAEALTYAEAQGVVHRDIKPENIMVAGESVKLADLGLAQQLGEDGETPSDPKARKVMGTPMYMSPEQARGLAVGHASDQYSLGATLFHMLTGRAPFSGTDGKAIMKAHVVQPVPDPREVSTDVPESWRTLCMRLMAKDPVDRFPAAADLRQAVAAAINGETAGRRGRSLRHTTAAVGGHRQPGGPIVPLAIAGLVVVVLVVGWFLVPGRGGGRSPSSVPVEPPTVVKVDESLIGAKRLVVGLSSDHSQAIVALDRALSDGSLSPAARGVLGGEKQARLKALREAEGAKRDSQISTLAAIDDFISRGDLAQAKSRLDAFPGKGVEDLTGPKRDETVARLNAAIAVAVQRLTEQIAKANRETLQRIKGEVATLPLTNVQRDAAEAALAAREKAMEVQAASRAATAQVESSWGILAKELERWRYGARYADAKGAIDKVVTAFPTPESKALAGMIRDAADLAAAAEESIRGFCKTKSPTATLRIGRDLRKVSIVDLGETEVQVRPASSAVTKMDRSQAPVDYAELAQQALGSGREREVLAFLLFWDPAAAGRLAAKLGDDPLAKAVVEVERRRPTAALGGRVVRKDDGRVTVVYEFSPGSDKAWFADFIGETIEPGDGGLVWRCPQAIERGDAKESSMPTLRWKARVVPPCRIEARVLLSKSATLTAVGVRIGENSARLAVNLRHANGIFVGTLFTGDSGNFTPGTQGEKPNGLDPSQPVVFGMEIDSAHRLKLTYNGNVVDRDHQLPVGPVGLIFQLYQFAPGGALEIERVVIEAADIVIGE